MQAGRLRQRVTLRTFTESQDGFGELIKTWADLATVWAAVLPLRGREYMDSRELQVELSVRILIRYRADVTSLMRVVHGVHTYEIVSPPIADATHERQLELMCREIDPEAL